MVFNGDTNFEQKGGLSMGRGKGFDHKRKGHPGDFPEGTLVEGKDKKITPDDDELIFVKEAFKNRIDEEER